MSEITLHRAKVKSVKFLRQADDEYVYDIGMKNENHPWFFGNNILVHNSVYFSAYPIFKPQIEAGTIEWTKDSVTELYDTIGELVNDSFPEFMAQAFNCPQSRGEIIKAGREIVGTTGIFIAKKRYAVLVYDKEGKRKDVNGKQGEIKAMGLDLRRSDTPVYIQEFLSEILEMVLTGSTESAVIKRINEFRIEFKKRPGWEKGSPKRANNIGEYIDKMAKTSKVTVPGHVRASINYNTLVRMNADKHAVKVVDGAKVIVCKLKANQMGFTSVAYPVDEPHLPQWFKDLPFDHDGMETSVLDNKIENMLSVLNWQLGDSADNNMFNSLFDW
jgi:hypothetical protein